MNSLQGQKEHKIDESLNQRFIQTVERFAALGL